MSETKKSITPMEHYNMSDFLRGQSSRIITTISEEDKAGFVLKNGKPMAVIISNEVLPIKKSKIYFQFFHKTIGGLSFVIQTACHYINLLLISILFLC